MNLKNRKKLAYRVAFTVWGQHPAPARLGKARRMIETLLDDDDWLSGIPGLGGSAEQQNAIFDEAVRKLKRGIE